MRKVVSEVAFTCTKCPTNPADTRCRYDRRHMAQEDHLKETKTKEELEHTKSTIRCVCPSFD